MFDFRTGQESEAEVLYAVARKEQKWSNGTEARVCIHRLKQRREPVWRQQRVVVQEKENIGLRQTSPKIGCMCESLIFWQMDALKGVFPEFFAQYVQVGYGLVRRCVIDDEDFDALWRVLLEGPQRLGGEGPLVEDRNDDGHLGGGHVGLPAHMRFVRFVHEGIDAALTVRFLFDDVPEFPLHITQGAAGLVELVRLDEQ